jgi:hypothetical protein
MIGLWNFKNQFVGSKKVQKNIDKNSKDIRN